MAISGKDAARRDLWWWLAAFAVGYVLVSVCVGLAKYSRQSYQEKATLQRELDNAHQRVRDLEVEVDDLRKMLNRERP